MKKLNKKGFTLIELLAVIVIMGILMMVAIPAMQRYINNSRKDTFLSTAKEYVNAVRNLHAADELSCAAGTKYYVAIDSSTNKNDLLQSGGKSSWGSDDVKGFVIIDGDKYYVQLTDGTHGVVYNASSLKEADKLTRNDVAVTGGSYKTTPGSGYVECTAK